MCMNSILATLRCRYWLSSSLNADLMAADSLAMTSRSSAAVLQARTARMSSRSLLLIPRRQRTTRAERVWKGRKQMASPRTSALNQNARYDRKKPARIHSVSPPHQSPACWKQVCGSGRGAKEPSGVEAAMTSRIRCDALSGVCVWVCGCVCVR